MTFRLNEYRAKLQITTSAQMPMMIYRACLATGAVSNTVYCQHAIAEALSRDLGIPLAEIVDALPPPRGPAAHVFNPDDATMNRFKTVMTGPANTVEEVE